jgi:hypothetical protein
MKYPMDLQGGVVQRFGKLGADDDQDDLPGQKYTKSVR